MKHLLLIISLFLSVSVFARHIKGGEVYYEYLGPGAGNNDKFRITVRLFIDCSSSGSQIDPDIALGIFRNADNRSVSGSPFILPNTFDSNISLTTPSPCIVNPSIVCYRVRLYSSIIELPKDPKGYTAIFQRCCRIDRIHNLNPNISVGASYTCQIHGYDNLGPNEVNSNPQFLVKDTVLICQNRKFTLDFGATDSDNDSLSYEFCSAYNGGSNGTPVVREPPPPSQLNELSYANGFSGSNPLGPDVSLNSKTGIISGIAPSGGDYVVSVCLTEWRRGKVISTHRKDFILKVDANCDFAAADLKPEYVTCDGYDFTFQNEAPFSTLIHSYYWDFGIPGRTDDTSTLAKPKFLFPDTGVYQIKLVINPGEECSDSAITFLKVYPGFFPKLAVDGSCRFTPFFFRDNSTTRYGNITKWLWQFGDETTTRDSSLARDAQWQYATTGYKKVTLTVESSKGCIGTAVLDSLEVKDKPTISMPFRDTLICSIDTLQLAASGGGNFSWQPNTFAINTNTANPLVFPKTTTVYKVTINDNGCINSDSVRVRVVDFVSLDAGADTTICLTDRFSLNPNSNGLRFSWTPAATLLNPNTKRPLATPLATITYQVLASIGKCNATDNVTVRTVPYPVANAGKDTVICYEDTAQLKGLITGASFTWSPASSLINASTLSPLAFPLRTTPYVLTVRDNLGCPKPKLDTVVLTVRPKILADAGRDTSIVAGQPLQLSASGAELFEWSPPQGLNRTNSASPTATLRDNMTYYIRVSNEEGCFSYDTLHVKVFRTQPDIFVPNAFTPEAATNNRFRPIPVGISTIDFFRVYNRWGQLIFSSNDSRRGWDGTLGGKQQDAGTYVWMVQGKDYTGKTVFKKGTMVLIR